MNLTKLLKYTVFLYLLYTLNNYLDIKYNKPQEKPFISVTEDYNYKQGIIDKFLNGESNFYIKQSKNEIKITVNGKLKENDKKESLKNAYCEVYKQEKNSLLIKFYCDPVIFCN